MFLSLSQLRKVISPNQTFYFTLHRYGLKCIPHKYFKDLGIEKWQENKLEEVLQSDIYKNPSIYSTETANRVKSFISEIHLETLLFLPLSHRTGNENPQMVID